MYLLCVYDVGRRCTGWRGDCDSRANLIKHDLTDTHRLIAALSPRYMHTIILFLIYRSMQVPMTQANCLGTTLVNALCNIYIYITICIIYLHTV